MKYKISTKIKIKSWSKMEQEFGLDTDGNIKLPNYVFTISMKKFCDKVVTIKKVHPNHYHIKKDIGKWCWIDDMIDHPATRILSIINRLEKLKKLISDIEKPLDVDIKILIDTQIKVLKSKKPYFTEENIKIYNKMFHEIKTNGNFNFMDYFMNYYRRNYRQIGHKNI